MRDSRQEILHFWFEESDPSSWFQISDKFDEQIRERFSVVYEMAKDGLSNHWADDADGALALCLTLSQFPRRIYRGKAQAYESDDRALIIAKQAISRGFDQLMPHEKRFYFYMPIENSENLTDQKRNLDLFKAMQDENPIAYTVAERRYNTIEKFGRFPERNAALDRDSTDEELEYLKGQHDRF